MKTTTTKCDSCDKDLTYTTNCVDYCISLQNENITPQGPRVTAAMIYPPLKHRYYFCGVVCLKSFVEKL